jgi:1,4-dihydroxy-6-naphthoate synthase
VMYKHIDLYVNHYSVELGEDGRRAVALLFEKAAALGLVPASSEPLFLESGLNT